MDESKFSFSVYAGLAGGAVLTVILIAAVVGYAVGNSGRDEVTVTQGTTPTGDEITVAPAFTADELAADPTANWATNGGSLANQRYSPLDQINTGNVADLKGVWMSHLDGSGVATKYSGEATPIVYEGVIYTVTGADDVFATSLTTGKTLWKYEANLDQKISTVCCGWTSRGVAIGEGMVYVGQLDGKLVALDQATGKPVWKATVGRWQDGETVTSAPLYYNGRVYSGVSGGEFGIRGRLTAYDAQSGQEEWRFWTIPGPGKEGHDTWPAGNDSWKSGGAPVWGTPAVDPELGLIYFSTGNASPDLNGSARAGDNLFATSIVALDAETGSYRWHFQQVHHDIWDYDAPSPVVLWDAEIDGETVQGLSQPGKTGWLYMLNRETGEPIHGITEKQVPQMDAAQATADTQPFPDTPPFSSHKVDDEEYQAIVDLARESLGPDVEMARQRNIFDPFAETGVVLAPGPSGGTNWPPSSFNPDTNMVYVCGIDSAAGYQSTELQKLETGTTYLSSVLTVTGFGSYDGVLAAVDVTTGDVAWTKSWAEDACYSGTTTTAGGLVFVGRNDGRLQAYDAATGKELWSFQTGAGANATPAVFEYDGAQYLAFYAAGNSLAASSHGDNLWLFSLDGTMGPAKAGGAAAQGEHAGEGDEQVEQEESTTPNEGGGGGGEGGAGGGGGGGGQPAGTDARDTGAGEQVFADNCSVCHGVDGTGGNGGPDLTAIPAASEVNAVVDQVTNGGGGMPAFGGQLSGEEISAVAAYVTQSITGGG